MTLELLWTAAAVRGNGGDSDEALALNRELRDALARTPPDERRQSMLAVLTGLAGCLQATQHWDEAEVPLRQAWALFGEQRDEQLLFTRRHGQLGVALRLQGWSAEAEQCYRRTLEVQQRLLGPEHLETDMTFEQYGTFLRYAGRLDDALAVRQQHLAARQSKPGNEPMQFAMIQGQIGQLLSRMGRDTEATEAFLSAVSLSRKASAGGVYMSHAWWRESVIRLGYGLHKPWASQSLRWHGCRALDDALRAAPTESFSQDELQWETFRFRLEQWTNGEPQSGTGLSLVDEGDLERFHGSAEPPPGVYRLSVSVERRLGPAIETSV